MGMDIRTMAERANAVAHAIFIDMHEKLEALFARLRIAKLDHLAELPGRVDMQKGKWRRCWIKRLHRQMHHDRRILAHRIEHDRIGKGCCDFAKNMDRFCFETLQMRQVLGQGCMMHDIYSRKPDRDEKAGLRF